MQPLRIAAALALVWTLALPVGAQEASPLSVKAFRSRSEGVNVVFTFEIANALDREIRARGRLVVLNVYDTDLPTVIAVPDTIVPPGGATSLEMRWNDAPLIGQVRGLLVLNDGLHPSLVHAFTVWIIPWLWIAGFAGAALLIVLLALTVARLPRMARKIKEHVPSDMIAYVVEYDDTVVTLSSRFDVSWQDIVRANRLKPPYTLKPGKRILIPKHGLKRPPSSV